MFFNSVVLPLYPPLCFKFAKILKRLNFKVTFKAVNKCNFHLTKPLIPELYKWGIYKVPCKDCNLFYIGQTKCNLETCLSKYLCCESRDL